MERVEGVRVVERVEGVQVVERVKGVRVVERVEGAEWVTGMSTTSTYCTHFCNDIVILVNVAILYA